jgi:hypothetical protein
MTDYEWQHLFKIVNSVGHVSIPADQRKIELYPEKLINNRANSVYWLNLSKSLNKWKMNRERREGGVGGCSFAHSLFVPREAYDN